MASDKNAGQAGTKTADAAESTQQMAPVPAAPTTSGKDRVSAPADEPTEDAPSNGKQSSAPATGETSSTEQAPAPEEAAPAETAPSDAPAKDAAAKEAAPSEAAPAAAAPTNGSAMKDGAVKAAAAALAAARSAAKKVQSAASSSTGAEPPDAASAGSQSAPPPPPSPGTTQSASRPEMHYSAGGVHGSAQAEASPAAASTQYGAQYGAPTGAQPTMQSAASPSEGIGSPRRVRLSVSRIDPWSIMKLAFLLSVAIGIMIVVATGVVWYSLNSLGTFSTIQEFLIETMGPQTIDIVQFVQLERMLSLSTLIALVNMVLFTAIATIMAILYNITAALVGGVHLTLTDD